MDNKKRDEIIRTRSLSECKEKFLSGELYSFMTEMELRLMRSLEERNTIRMKMLDQQRHDWSGDSPEVREVRRIQTELMKKFVEASEQEADYWTLKMYEVEREIAYHQMLLDGFKDI